MADDQTAVTPAPQTTPETPAVPAAPPEGVFHHIARIFGIDPDATVTAAKAFLKDPVQATKEVASQIPATTKASAKATVADAKDLATNPETRFNALVRMVQPGELGVGEEGLESGAKSIADRIHEAGTKARESMDARRESRIADAKTGKVITVEPDKPAPAAQPRLGSGQLSEPDHSWQAGHEAEPKAETAEAPPTAPIKISTDTLGVKWAENADGVRVSIPARIAPEEVQAYAQDKLSEQATAQAKVKGETAPMEAHATYQGKSQLRFSTPEEANAWIAENKDQFPEPDAWQTEMKPKRVKDIPSDRLSTNLADHITFDDAGGKELQTPAMLAKKASPEAESAEIKAEGPEWDRTHSAVIDGKKVGSVGYKLDPDGRAQIYGSQVSPELRGKGIGQKMYREAIADAQAAGASRITSDSTNTSPEANRVWEKLREQGLPVENITHPNGKPGYEIDFENPPEPVTPQQPALPEPQHEATLAARGQLPGQTVNLSPAYGDTGGYVGGLVDRPAVEDLQTNERQSQLKEPYRIQVQNEDGLSHVVTVDAFSSTDALKTAQKQYPGTEYSIQPDSEGFYRAGKREPNAAYAVPSEKPLSVHPQSLRPALHVIRHELGHAMIGQDAGLTQTGMLRHTHPDLPGAVASVAWKAGDLYTPGTQTIKPDKRAAVIKLFMGGIAADEELNDIPRAANHNFDTLSSHSDGAQAYQILKAAGFEHGAALEYMHKMIDAGKEYLQRPEVAGIIKENEGVREPDLSRQYHYSAERLANMAAEAKRRIENGKQISDNGTTGSGPAADRQANVAEGKSGISGTTEEAVKTDAVTKEPFKGTHYSSKPIGDTLLGENRGMAAAGSEKDRLQHANKVPGVYVYREGSRAEPQIAARANKSTVSGDKAIADIGGAQKQLFQDAHDKAMAKYKEAGNNDTVAHQKAVNDAERALKNKGFDGYENKAAKTGSVFLFGDHPVDKASIQTAEKLPEKAATTPTDQNWYAPPIADNFFLFASPEEHASQASGFKPGEWNVTEQEKVSPNSKLQESAQKYAKAQGMDEINHAPVKADPARAKEIAKIYDEAKHDPNDPRVKAAYDALKSETLAQFHHLRDDLGLKFEPQTKDPYMSVGDMMTDIKKNNRLKVFSGSGPGPGEDHPLSAIEPKTGESYNTIFRWVHDAMGHAAGGNDFSENGEKSATEAHAQMYSDTARPAMRAETEGQTSWFFHNPEVEAGRAKPGDFAPQKAMILPDTSADWHTNAGDLAAKNDAGAINPRTGKMDSKGIGVEVLPELRQPLKKTPTAADFQKFYEQHKDVFDKNPELRVGWDNNSGEPGGHEINVGAVGPGAPDVARKLDQIAAFDIAKGKNIDTGGTGKTREFPDYPFDARMKDLKTAPTLSTNETLAAKKGIPAGSKFVPSSPEEYRAELDRSPRASEFLKESADELRDHKIFKLQTPNGKDTGIAYSITPKGEMRGLVNNGPYNGASGPAIEHSFQNGATHTQPAWDVNGRLAGLYNTLGGGKVISDPYDEATYGVRSDAMKAAWRKAGWKDNEPYPNFTRYVKNSSNVSTRVPWGVKNGVEFADHSNQARLADMDAAKEAPGYVQKMVNKVKDVPGFVAPKGGDAQAAADAYIRHVADNVKFVYGKMKPEEIARDEQWYPVGAHERVLDVAKKHNYTPEQIAGVTAVESPMTDWDASTSLADRTANIWRNQQNTKFTDEMRDAADRITDIPANAKFKKAFKPIIGKTLGELDNDVDRALWLRLYDEGHNPRDYETWNPDGTTNGPAKNADGSNKKVGWSFQNHIEKAISILRDGAPENISKQLGFGHKVRNFYNNMITPDDPRYLTVDTHAVNVGQLRPMSGKNPAVASNFGQISNGPYGLSGTYPMHDAAYRLAAKELDIPIPGRLQSPTWTKIRNVFTDDFKTKENLNAVDAIWKEHNAGKITADQARNRIWDYAAGWHAGAAQKNGPSGNPGELPQRGLFGEPVAGAAGSGNRGAVAPGTSETAVGDNEGDTSFNFGANEKPEPSSAIFARTKPAGKVKKGGMSAMDLLDALDRLKKPAK